MARNKISEAYVEFKSKGLKGVSADAQNATAELKKTEQQAKGTGSAFGRMGQAAQKVQGAVSKILIPVAVATSIAGVARRFTEMAEQAKAFREQLDAITANVRSQNLGQAFDVRGVGDLQREQSELLRQFQENQKAVLDTISEVEKRGTLLGSAFRGVASLFSDEPVTNGEKVAVAMEKINELNDDFLRKRQLLQQLDDKRTAEMVEQVGLQNELLRAEVSGDEIRQATVARQQQINRLIERAASLREDEKDAAAEAVEQQIELLNRLNQIAAEKIRERQRMEAEAIRERERAEIEAAKRVAQAIADANAQAMQRAASEFESSMQRIFDSQNGQVAQIADLMRDAVAQLRNIERRRR